MPRSTTVLQLVPRLEAGGAERATLDIAAALRAAGHRALVMSAGGEMVKELRSCGAEHVEWEVGRKNPWTAWRNGSRLVEFIQRENIDLVHARSRVPAWSAYMAARTAGVPLVTTFHNAYSGNGAAKKFYNSVMTKGDRVIAISRFIAEHIRANYGTPDERIAVIPRGIDFSIFSPAAVSRERRQAFRDAHKLSGDVPFILMPGRLSPTKCHELALRALSTLSGRSFRCLIVGPGQGRDVYRRHLVGLARTLDLQDKVDFLERADLPAAYAVADVVLSLSQKIEGFGRVAAEAQAMGIPVIATNIGALPETIRDGETGWLVPRGDAQALCGAIDLALSLENNRLRTMAQAAMAHVRAHFNVRQMCASTLRVYADLLPS